jgi:hypothetical protein
MKQSNKNILASKLERFVRTYYNSIIVRGSIFSVITLLILFLFIIIPEYFLYFSSLVRGLLLYCFLGINAFVLSIWVLLPWFKKMGYGKRLSYEDAARIIGKHFSEIDDKLLNVLQLQSMQQEVKPAYVELLLASIEEKTQHVKPFQYQAAVDFRKNLRYLKIAAIPLLITLFIGVWNHQLLTAPTQRIVNYNQYYEKPAPYRFVLENKDLTAFQNEDFTLNIRIEGEEVPQEAFIQIGKAAYKLQKNSNTAYSYEFKKLQRTTEFYLFTEEVRSQNYKLSVQPKPIMLSFSIQLEYPSYLARLPETIENRGDISVPQGTKITWKFNTRNTDELIFSTEDKKSIIPVAKDKGTYSLRLMENLTYSVSNRNQYLVNSDSLLYFITAIPDLYPTIDVLVMNDSAFFDRFYFKGVIQDDYGFTKLTVNYIISDKSGKEVSKNSVSIPIRGNTTAQEFYHYFDAQTLGLEPSQTLEYYFEVWDNDGVNRPKSSRSTAMFFALPSLDELDRQSETANAQTRSDLSNLLKDSEKILKSIDELKRKLIDKNQPTWEEKKQLEQLLNQLQNIKQEMQAISQEQQKQQQINEQYNNIDEQLLEKQREIQRRFDELFSNEMKMQMQELQQLMEQNMDKNKLNQLLENIKLSTEDINKQLDQNLELFKQLEVDSKMQNLISKNKRLAEEQRKLAEETAKGNLDPQKQEAINQEFQQLKDDLKELEKLNKELEDPYKLEKAKEAAEEASKKLNQAKEQLQKNQKEKAAESQKDAADKMDEMAEQMEQSMDENEQESLGEDIAKMRQILNNIVKVSFMQEDLMQKTGKINPQDPIMREIIQTQFRMKEHLKMIDDSISAVARRQIMVQPFITKQVTKINQAQSELMELLNNTQEPTMQYVYARSNARNAQVTAKQQFIMTALNDLGLMIAESMKQMKDKQQNGQESKGGSCKNGKCGKKSCSKCNGGNGSSNSGKKSKSAKSMKEMQEKLNQQLEEMRKKLQSGGDKDGEGKPSNKQGGQSMSEQFARAAAAQEAIRKMMQEYQSELKKDGKGYGGEIEKMLKDMEQTEKDLINKIINPQTINRQQQIMTRLLESEKAEMQREREEKRESKQGIDRPNPNPPAYIEQQWKNKKETELYKTIPPTLNHYYKNKVNTYFLGFEN